MIAFGTLAAPLIRVRSDLPTRRRPPHHPPIERESRRVLLFLTTCTRDRKPILANEAAHELLRASWAIASAWRVGRYVIMPDHIHLFCAPADPDVSLSHWVRFWKSHVSRRWPDPSEQPIWQPSCWDTQLRRCESYEAKWEYVRRNPVRRGLVAEPERWPYAGVIDDLAW